MPAEATSGILRGTDIHRPVHQDVELESSPGAKLQCSTAALVAIVEHHLADPSERRGPPRPPRKIPSGQVLSVRLHDIRATLSRSLCGIMASTRRASATTCGAWATT